MEVKSNKLQTKDLINVGIFTAIYFVIFFAGMMLGYIPIFIPLLGLVCPIPVSYTHLDQVDHTAIEIFRHIAVFEKQCSGAVIGQIALQRIGPVGVDQSAAFANPERQNADALGHQFLVQPA